MQKVQISKFKEQCLRMVENMDAEGILLLKHGKPIARVVPVADQKEALIGSLKGKLRQSDALFSTDEQWHAES